MLAAGLQVMQGAIVQPLGVDRLLGRKVTTQTLDVSTRR